MTFEDKIDYQFADRDLLTRALTHKSHYNELGKKGPGHNEKLEFLGDAVIDLSLTELLLKTYPESSEGDLSKVRASLVNETVLAEIAKVFGLGDQMLLGRGELQTGGKEKPRLLASVFEAVVGALYLDAGFQKTHDFLIEVFTEKLKTINPDQGYVTDFKTRLQELAQERFRATPTYSILSESGPDHEKEFTVEVRVGKELSFTGVGRSKKTAEQKAAESALKGMEES
ncbi:MAG: ribonuclease III [Bdellovibrionales bacterium]|nr:ribonuclease III [Bdellovibrionales bacterium]